MLGASFFLSHKLDRLATCLLVAMCTIFCLGMLSEMYEQDNSIHKFAVSTQSRHIEN